MPYAMLSPPPGLMPVSPGYSSCWDGHMSLYPLARVALGVLIAAIILARMWFTPGSMPRCDRLREIGLFAAAGLACGLAWVALPTLIVVLAFAWDSFGRDAGNPAVATTIVLPMALVTLLALSVLILRTKPVSAHVATLRERRTLWQHIVFILCWALCGLWLPVALLAAIIADLNASDYACLPDW